MYTNNIVKVVLEGKVLCIYSDFKNSLGKWLIIMKMIYIMGHGIHLFLDITYLFLN